MGLYPRTDFVTCDKFSELQQGGADYKWDVCMPPAPELGQGRLDSVIANALLEHVIDPTCAVAHFMRLLKPSVPCTA